MSALPSFPPFSVHENAPDVRWKKWKSRLDNLLLAMGVKDDKERRRALLLHYAGEEVNEIFETLPNTGNDYDTAVTKLTEYFSPKKNTEFEVYKFWQAKQEAGETIDTYHTRLRLLSLTCEFAATDKEVKSQIIQGCASTRLRRRALREDMTLEELIKLERSMKIADKQAAEIENAEKFVDVNAMRKRRTVPRFMEKQKVSSSKDARTNENFFRCGGPFPHQYGKCPAKGKACNAFLRQFVELRTKETNLNQKRLRNLKLLPVVIAIQILIHNRELMITFSV